MAARKFPPSLGGEEELKNKTSDLGLSGCWLTFHEKVSVPFRVQLGGQVRKPHGPACRSCSLPRWLAAAIAVLGVFAHGASDRQAIQCGAPELALPSQQLLGHVRGVGTRTRADIAPVISTHASHDKPARHERVSYGGSERSEFRVQRQPACRLLAAETLGINPSRRVLFTFAGNSCVF